MCLLPFFDGLVGGDSNSHSSAISSPTMNAHHVSYQTEWIRWDSNPEPTGYEPVALPQPVGG